MKELTVIIVAGGSGSRMKTDFPKQFLKLAGKPILMHTIGRFAETYPESRIIVAMNYDYVGYWGKLCDEYSFDVNHMISRGGRTRFMSVKNALEFAPDTGFIAVHDGVRPLLSRELIERAVSDAKTFGAVAPVIPHSDSMREIDNSGSHVVDRDNYRIVQTPQIFAADILKKAYSMERTLPFTDDASVVEVSGHRVSLCEGEVTNIKITTPVDMIIAEALIEAYSNGYPSV